MPRIHPTEESRRVQKEIDREAYLENVISQRNWLLEQCAKAEQQIAYGQYESATEILGGVFERFVKPDCNTAA